MLAMLFVAARLTGLAGKTRCSGDSLANGGLFASQLLGVLQRPLAATPVQVWVPAFALGAKASRAEMRRETRTDFMVIEVCCGLRMWSIGNWGKCPDVTRR